MFWEKHTQFFDLKVRNQRGTNKNTDRSNVTKRSFHPKWTEWIFCKILKTNESHKFNGSYRLKLCIQAYWIRKQKSKNMFKKISIVYHTQSMPSASFRMRNVCPTKMRPYCTTNEIRKNQPETSTTKVLGRLNVIKNLDFKEYKERSTVILQNKWTNVYTFYERVFHMVLLYDSRTFTLFSLNPILNDRNIYFRMRWDRHIWKSWNCR